MPEFLDWFERVLQRNPAGDLPMRELERLIEALQRHWFVRKYVNKTNPLPASPLPETAVPETLGGVKLDVKTGDVNVVDAAGRGTVEGLHLAMNVVAMLISFIALIALVNSVLGWVGLHTPLPDDLSLQKIFGLVFAPIAWSLGVSWKDAFTVGNLLGTRMVLNEFIAFAQLGPMKDMLDPRSFTVATFALCGFANFASIGIQIGGIGALVPERRHDLARLGMRAMLAGTLANFVSACIAALLL